MPSAVIHERMPGSPPLLFNGDLHAGGLVMAMAAGLVEGHVCEGVRGVMSLDHCECVAWDNFREAFNGFLTHPDETGTTCSTWMQFNRVCR